MIQKTFTNMYDLKLHPSSILKDGISPPQTLRVSREFPSANRLWQFFKRAGAACQKLKQWLLLFSHFIICLLPLLHKNHVSMEGRKHWQYFSTLYHLIYTRFFSQFFHDQSARVIILQHSQREREDKEGDIYPSRWQREISLHTVLEVGDLLRRLLARWSMKYGGKTADYTCFGEKFFFQSFEYRYRDFHLL